MTAVATYRILQDDEWPKIEAIFQKHGSPAPEKGLSRIAIAEQDGEIIGFMVLQPVLHMEPLWMAPGQEVYWPELMRTLEGELKKMAQGPAEYCILSVDDTHVKELTFLGLTKTPFVIWRGRV